MGGPRTSRKPYGLVRFDERGRPSASVPVDARDGPSAWRRAEREAHGSSFALYDPDGARVRVGVAPPSALRIARPATAAALSPDGELVITGHDDGTLRVFDARTGTPRWERAVADSRVDLLIATRRAPWLIACTRAGEVRVVDRTTGQPVALFAADDARALALAADERTLALAGTAVEVWSLPEGTHLARFEVAPEPTAPHADDDAAPDEDPCAYGDEGLHAVGFARGGTHVVAARAHHGGELIVWECASGKRVAQRAGLPAERLAVLRNGLSAVLGARHEGASVCVVDLATLETRVVCAMGTEGLRDLRITADDRFALVHDEETGIYVLDVATGATHAWLDELEACAYVVAARAGARGHGARARATEDDTHVVALPRWRRGEPGETLSGDGRRFAALRHAQGEGLVALYDVAGCAPYAALAHSHAVAWVGLDHRGTRALTRDARGRVFVWCVPDAPERVH